jgi:uridylate kinase
VATTDPVLSARGRLAGLYSRDPDPAAVAEARTELNAAHVERAIQRALDAAPPLTTDQRSRLAALLTDDAR